MSIINFLDIQLFMIYQFHFHFKSFNLANSFIGGKFLLQFLHYANIAVCLCHHVSWCHSFFIVSPYAHICSRIHMSLSQIFSLSTCISFFLHSFISSPLDTGIRCLQLLDESIYLKFLKMLIINFRGRYGQQQKSVQGKKYKLIGNYEIT